MMFCYTRDSRLSTNKYRVLKYLLVGVIALWLVHTEAQARIIPTGVYFGNISGSCGNGSFGLMLTEEGRAYFLAHNSSDGAAEYRDTLSLDEKNVLSVVGIFNRQATARLSVSLSRAEGTIKGECSGAMTAQRASNRGAMKTSGGLWTGTAGGTITEPIEATVCTCQGFLNCLILGCMPETRIVPKRIGLYSGLLHVLAGATGQGYLLFVSENPPALNAGGPIALRQCNPFFPDLDQSCTTPPQFFVDCFRSSADDYCWLEGPLSGANISGEFFLLI
jgi:hypothetical protein